MRHYAIVAFFYSLLISSSILNENLTKINEIKEEYFANKQNIQSFIKKNPDQNYKLEIYSKKSNETKFERIHFNSATQQTITSEEKYINQTNSLQAILESLQHAQLNRQNENVRIFLDLSQDLAHSFKFFVYILFSVHLRFHFRYINSSLSKTKKTNLSFL